MSGVPVGYRSPPLNIYRKHLRHISNPPSIFILYSFLLNSTQLIFIYLTISYVTFIEAFVKIIVYAEFLLVVGRISGDSYCHVQPDHPAMRLAG